VLNELCLGPGEIKSLGPPAVVQREFGSSIGDKSRLQCAGLNRLEAEEEEASRERTSDPLGPEFCVGYREVHDEA
jgi:hypothetical protein